MTHKEGRDHQNYGHYLKKLFTNERKKERMKMEEEKKQMDSTTTETTMKRLDAIPDDVIVPHSLAELYPSFFLLHTSNTPASNDPKQEDNLTIGEIVPGVLFNGTDYVPLFCPKKSIGSNRWQISDEGYLVKTADGITIFFPESDYKIDEQGHPYLSTERRVGFQPVLLKTLDEYKYHLAAAEHTMKSSEKKMFNPFHTTRYQTLFHSSSTPEPLLIKTHFRGNATSNSSSGVTSPQRHPAGGTAAETKDLQLDRTPTSAKGPVVLQVPASQMDDSRKLARPQSGYMKDELSFQEKLFDKDQETSNSVVDGSKKQTSNKTKQSNTADATKGKKDEKAGSKKVENTQNSSKKVKTQVKSHKMKTPKDGAIVVQYLVELCPMGLQEHVIDLDVYGYVGGTAETSMRPGEQVNGTLVSGPNSIPLFYPTGSNLPPNTKISDVGSLIKNAEGKVLFYPVNPYTFCQNGFPRILEDKQGLKTVSLSVLSAWKGHMEAVDAEKQKKIRNHRNQLENKEKEEELQRLILEETVEGRWILYNKIVAGVIGFLLLALLFAVIGLGVRPSCQKSKCSPVVQPCKCTCGTGSGVGGIGEIQPTEAFSASTSNGHLATTTSIVYPLMIPIKRVPIIDLEKPTFRIDSFLFEINTVSADSFPRLDTTKLTFTLHASEATERIQLRCGEGILVDHVVLVKSDVVLEKLGNHLDKETGILTINMPQADRSNTTVEIVYKIPSNAFERFSVTCGTKKCNAFVNRQLSSLVPHFHDSMKHPWSVIVQHPQYVKVLTNNRPSMNSTLSYSVFESNLLFPSEVTFALIENFANPLSRSTKLVESYYSRVTNAHEVYGLEKTLESVIHSKSNLSTLSKQVLYILVLPTKETYEFIGRNIAIIGENLLNSNKEIMLDFAWRWIFRTIIYEKTRSSDNNPTWIYDHSAVFLSTSVVSAKKDIWKKHHYAVSMERGHIIMTKGFTRSIIYEDELRYLENPAFVGKVSTVLGILTSAAINENPLAKLDGVRDNSTSNKFFFVKSDVQLATGQSIQVDKFTSCYMDSLDMPRLHISRIGTSSVVIKRSDGGTTDRCDIILWYVKAVKGGNTSKKEQILLREKEEQVEIQSDSPILLAGDVPSYYYTMDEDEFNRVQNNLGSYDKSSLKMLFSNSFKAAEEGKLSYKSVDNFMKLALQQKIVTVDEAVDSVMSTVAQSRNEMLTNRIEMIIAHVLQAERNTTSSSSVPDYVQTRLENAVNEDTLFEIEKVKMMHKKCGYNCRKKSLGLQSALLCITNKEPNCTYIPHLLEIFVSSAVVMIQNGYETYEQLYTSCYAKSCVLPILRGLLCTQNKETLDRWLEKVMNLGETDMMNRQIFETTIKGLAINDASKSMLFPYFMENWHLLHKKYSKFPSLLGSLVDTISSTICTREQLDEFKSFVSFHGHNLDMYREFERQIINAEKWIEWNDKHSEEFSRVFAA